MATLVKFVKETDGDFKGTVVAIFPQLKFNKALYGNNCVMSYAHVGQHSAAGLEWANKMTEPATEDEYLPLKQELESIGYNLKICK